MGSYWNAPRPSSVVSHNPILKEIEAKLIPFAVLALASIQIYPVSEKGESKESTKGQLQSRIVKL